MKAWRTFPVFPAVLAVVTTQAASEDQLKAIWDAHLASPRQHEAAQTACLQFARAHPGDPLLPMAQGILAWHLFQEGKTPEALELLKPHLNSAGNDPVMAAARRIAGAWTTRALRGQVVAALQAFYRKEVAYPASVADLAAHPALAGADRPPLTDAFGNPWIYRLTGFKGLPGFEGQRYLLQSGTLGETSDLAVALQMPYAAGIEAGIERVIEGAPPKVLLRTGGRGGLLVPGQEMGALSLAFAGGKIVVLANHSFWKIYPRP